MINSQRRLFGRLTISFKICVMLYRTAVLKEIKIFNHHRIFPAWASLSNLLVWILHLWAFIQWQGRLLAPSQLCLQWGSPKIGAGAAALCYTQDLTGANHSLTWFFKQVQFRSHQVVAAVSPSWAFSLWRDLKLSLRHIHMEARPPPPT